MNTATADAEGHRPPLGKGRMALPFFTIGHSTRPIADFVDLLRRSEVQYVADVRTIPRSRTNPQYNIDALPGTLSDFQIGYTHLAELGGLRSRAPGTPSAINAFWKNQSFHNFADYAMTEAFSRGLARLQELGHAQRCAIMCAEVLWWRCHRRIITDYLLVRGEAVFHILAPDQVAAAKLTTGARIGAAGIITYPPRTQATEPFVR